MSETQLLGLAAIIVLGVLAQWLSWRLHLPAILLLLMFGILSGPVLGILDPNNLFGNLLFPLVSVSVAIILFEGGLSLRIPELSVAGKPFRQLITTGIVITWILAALAAHYLAGLNWDLAFLLGAIMVVSGPTVVIPLLRQVRPAGAVGSIAKWEGIVNDPIGAILAVLVFEVVLSGQSSFGFMHIIGGVLSAALAGTLIGLAAAGVIVLLLRRYLIPDFLQNPFSLMLVVASYLAANMIQEEAGLLAVTVMGIALANQKYVSIRHILEFKENLRVLLIASLFIILAARLSFVEMSFADFGMWAFVAILIILVRPLAVWGATYNSKLTSKEKGFLAWVAPRGIVAAAVVSVFAEKLIAEGVEGAEALVPITFAVIIGTVTVYGISLPSVARLLGVAQPDPQGVLFAGACPWTRRIAEALQKEGFAVTLVDSNWSNITAAKNAGLKAFYANVLSEDIHYDVPLDGIGKLLAVTPNDEVNSLAVLHFVDLFGKSGVFQLAKPEKGSITTRKDMPKHMRGRDLFASTATWDFMAKRLGDSGMVKRHTISEEFTFADLKSLHGEDVLPLFIVTEQKSLIVCTSENAVAPKPGQVLFSVVERMPDEGG